ncbi:MAG: clostripain-related cysteine peptidase [bacterium]|nr:clostripain-related cysteine peptidase [bacterium]
MGIKNKLPSPRVDIIISFGALFLLFFENICFGSQWTMMFYMAADNDLSGQAQIDIKELQKISGQPGVDIIVQIDSPSGAFRYKVLPQGTSILASLGQSNSGSPDALADFGSWAVKTYPAQKYLLALWDHGSGWSKYSKYVGYDQHLNDYLNVAGGELRSAVAEISSAAGQPLEIIVFDACLMQMAEVLMELEGMCRYAVGSEAPFPVEGMPYDQAWKKIDGNTPAESLVVRLVNSCSVYDNLGYQVTCSAVDIKRLSAASQNLKSLAGPLKRLPVSAFISSSAIPDSAVPDSVSCFFSWYSYDLSTMLDFIGNRIPDPEKTLVLDASRQFKNSVLIQSISGNDYQNASGVAAWYPKGKNNFESGIESYNNLKWTGLSGWDKILDQLIFQKDITAPVPQKVKMNQTAMGGRLAWETGYEPSGIELYQVRHSKALIIDFFDQAGTSDTSNWTRTGFVIIPKADGDTAYYSISGQMTSKKAIQFDSSGNIGFDTEGINGFVVLESSSDSSTGWDTLGIWNYFGEAQNKYCSSKIKNTTANIRISWNTSHSGWLYIDDIKVCHPDFDKTVKINNTFVPSFTLSSLSGLNGFYQIRVIDSLKNISSWSKETFYRSDTDILRAWPNPFKRNIYISFLPSKESVTEVKIFNILGQYVDRMSLLEKGNNNGKEERLYLWEPKVSIAEGVYIARLDSNTGIRLVKMIFIR